LLDRLCEDCNRRLGQELDQELMRTGPTGLQRTILGVEGRRGAPKVGPFQYKAMQAEPPTTMMMPALGRDHVLLGEAYRDELGRPAARPIRQVVLRMPDGSMACVPFSRAWNADQLREAVNNRGLQKGVPQELYLDDDEDATNPEDPHTLEVRAALTAVFGPGFRVDCYGGPGDLTQNQLVTVSGINLLSLRAIAKVAFHYFLWACPALRGDEGCFAPLRAFIMEGTGDWRGFVELQAPQFMPPLARGYVPERTSHFFHADLRRERAVTSVQFFAGPLALPPPARVQLAANPLMLEATILTCHQASYFDDEEEKRDGHDGELIAIEVAQRRIITSLPSR
jgi:hypothetical protein